MARCVHQDEQLAGKRVSYQVEYAASDLFGGTHADLDGDLPVDDPVDLAGASTGAEREDDIVRAEPFPEGLTENIFGIAVVLPHGPEATHTNVFPLST